MTLLLAGCSPATPAETPDGKTPAEGIETPVGTPEEDVEAPEEKKEKTPEEKAEEERVRKEKAAELIAKLEQQIKDKEQKIKDREEAYTALSDEEKAKELGMTLEKYLELEESSQKISDEVDGVKAAIKKNLPYDDRPKIAKEILTVTNRYREQEGLPPLEWSDALAKSAQDWNVYMFTENYWEHNKTYPVAENLWLSGDIDPYTIDAERIVESWWNSPGHKKNLLHPTATHLGVSVVIAQTTHYITGEKGKFLFATQHFIAK